MMLTMCLMLGVALLVTAAMGQDALFEDVHVVKMEKGQYGPRGMPGDIIELKDGSLLMCYTAGGIVGRTSTDKGRTWSEQFPLVPNPGPSMERGYYCHPSFARLANGDILLSYIYGSESLPYYGHNYYRRSRDEGKTWENPRHIGADPEDDYGYQSVTFVDDMAIISYHARDGLHVARIKTDWFYQKD